MNQPKFNTTQEVLEDMIRSMCNDSGTDPEECIADFRTRFAGQFDHPPIPLVIAMAEYEKQESKDLVACLQRMQKARILGRLDKN